MKALGEELALELYESFSLDTMAAGRVETDMILVVDSGSGSSRGFLQVEHAGFPVRPQRGTSLGESMYNTFKNVFSLGYRRVTLIGFTRGALRRSFFRGIPWITSYVFNDTLALPDRERHSSPSFSKSSPRRF